jgi:hypothetical protein
METRITRLNTEMTIHLIELFPPFEWSVYNDLSLTLVTCLSAETYPVQTHVILDMNRLQRMPPDAIIRVKETVKYLNGFSGMLIVVKNSAYDHTLFRAFHRIYPQFLQKINITNTVEEAVELIMSQKASSVQAK